MRVLLVDDEPRVLQGLVRSLFHLPWEVDTAGSGDDALRLLDADEFDVIISDMRMPGMTGGELLGHVKARHPEVVRIMLSGQTGERAAMQLVHVAHQFLSKPCSARTIEDVIARTFELRSLLADPKLRSLVGQVGSLPSVPRVYQALTNALADPSADLATVSKLIGQDPAMCAKLLQLVNSSFFGNASPVSDIHSAVVRLGLRLLKDLALTVEVFHGAKNLPRVQGLSVEEMQRHALLTGLIARSLAGDVVSVDDAFVAGVLHDVGSLVLLTHFPDALKRALVDSHELRVPRHIAEYSQMGVSHAELGACLLASWGLPYSVVEAVAHHQCPGRVRQPSGIDLVGVVHVADCLADKIEPDRDYLENLGVTEDQLEAWRARAEEIELGELQ